jgi:flagellar biosynthetic protein FliR
VIDLAVVIRFGLLLVRPGMLVMVAPSLGGTYAPAPVKVATTVLLALVLAPTVSVAPAATDVSLTLIIAREVVIGLSLGLAVRALVGAAELGGHLSGYQIGFSYAATIDPVSGVRNSVITSLYGLLAMLAFFAVNGHHQVLRALVASYDGLPIGGGHVDASLLASVREILGLIFIAGLRLAAPLVLVLLIVELAIGLMSRSAPALNFMAIGYPVRVVVGLIVLAAMVGTIPQVIATIVERSIGIGLQLAAAFR